MNTTIHTYLEGILFGDMQAYGHVAVFPLCSPNGAGPVYLTLKEALEGNLLTITEVSEGGHVPELKVKNRAEKPVLLLDGEELAGAKQNRVLNTTILLKEMSETVIPVSCTEQGRWSYQTAHFTESGHVMSARLRSMKAESVSRSLYRSRRFDSDQGAVWDGIEAQFMAAGVRSPTGAMRDIHEYRAGDLEQFMEHFACVPSQKGLLVMVNGEVVGMDMISRYEAFALLYSKLLRSYLMDALLEKPGERKEPSREKALAFVRDIFHCRENSYESIGYGTDYRYEGKNLVGSALIHEEAVIHMAFFRMAISEKNGYMAGTSRRRRFRQ